MKAAQSRAVQSGPSRLEASRPDSAPSYLPYAAATVLVLVPCFWQTRIQAGDLSSHIYNAWLAQRIASGGAPGLTVVFQSTNILFDWLLSGLLNAVGAAAAQRIAVAIAVLLFSWGAFAFARTVGGKEPWPIAPVIAVLAYGWVFHAGFFNFYLSLGLCFWALALAWNRRPRGMAMAAALFAFAWLGHNLPVLWSIAILGYAWIADAMRPAARARLLGLCVAGLIVIHVIVRATMLSQWYSWQALLTTGADQAHVFDDKYYLCSAAIFSVFAFLSIALVTHSSLRAVVNGIPFQICLLSAAIVAILPTAIIGRGLQAAFISDRMSLPLGIAVCALLGPVTLGRYSRAAIAAVAVLFFAFLYRDERLLNQFEDRLEQAVAQTPPGVRIISAIDDPDLHVNALTHMIDRVCLERCYSYANYEASTGQFRIRVTGKSPIVASTYEDSWRMQNGSYVVKERDLPLYIVRLDDARRMVVQILPAGERTGAQYWKALPDL